MHGLPVDKGRGRSDADAAVCRALAGEHRAGLVGDFAYLERRVEAEADSFGMIRRRKADQHFGRQMVRGRVDFGVDDVAGDSQRGPLRPLGCKRSRHDESAGQAGQAACQRRHPCLHTHAAIIAARAMVFHTEQRRPAAFTA